MSTPPPFAGVPPPPEGVPPVLPPEGVPSSTDVRAAARHHTALGRAVVVIPPRSKRPTEEGWQTRRYTDAQLAELDPSSNLGLVLGSASGGLVDVDLDCPEARALAPDFLPRTAMRHGRPSTPESHYWYVVDAPPPSVVRYQAPIAARGDGEKACLVELRSSSTTSAAQTVIPPSVHPSGERLEWMGGSLGEPARVELTDLQEAVARLAAAALLARRYPAQGRRNDHALALAGLLLGGGMAETDAHRLVFAAARAGGSTEPDKRANAVFSTAKQLAAGEPVTGGPRLAEIIGDGGTKVVSAITKWLGLRGGRAVRGTPAQAPTDRGGADHPYAVEGGEIGAWRSSNDGERYFAPLTNFAAQIVEELRIDDGSDQVRHFYRISGTLADGTALPDARIDAAAYTDLKWIGPSWGARAVVVAGYGITDQTREAIQRLSTPERRTIYRHTGWRDLDGGHVYLHGGGGVGAEGVSVELQGPLARLQLPDPDPAIRLEDAVRASLAIRDIGPAEIVLLLLGAVYLAPVASLISPDFALWFLGPSGSFKSELAALAQAHYGPTFERAHLPVDWIATENAIEMQLFTAKDAILVVDDYAPQADPRAQREIEKKAQRIIRSAGNLSGRGRLRADLSQRPDRPPRALMIATGEDRPPGESILGRLVVVEVDRDAIDLAALSRAQGRRTLLAHALRGYVDSLRASYGTTAAAELRQLHESYVRDLRIEGAHPRTAVALAYLRLGVELLARYAIGTGALDSDGADCLRAEAMDALRNVGRRSAQPMAESTSAERFMAAVRSMLATGRARLRRADVDANAMDFERGDPIGWQDDKYAYLDDGETYRRVATYYRDSGQTFATSPAMTYKALAKANYIVPSVEAGETRYKVRVRCGGKSRRVLRVPLDVLNGSEADNGESTGGSR